LCTAVLPEPGGSNISDVCLGTYMKRYVGRFFFDKCKESRIGHYNSIGRHIVKLFYMFFYRRKVPVMRKNIDCYICAYTMLSRIEDGGAQLFGSEVSCFSPQAESRISEIYRISPVVDRSLQLLEITGGGKQFRLFHGLYAPCKLL